MIQLNTTRAELLNQLLSTWESREQQGMPVSPEELCQDDPDLASELRERIEAVRRFDRLVSPDSLGDFQPRPVVAPTSPPGFEIVEELGRGGMSVVYRAVQTGLNRPVALKMLLAGTLASPEEQQRFRSEAEIIAALRHPRIVEIHQVGEHDRQLYLVMEYVDGPTLAEWSRKHPFAPRAAAELLRTLAQAVQFAHERGVIHRDLKPANVLVARTGGDGAPLSLKIVDFGLAKTLTSDSQLTRTNAMLGTPSYMSPEQTGRGKGQVGPETDVYGLGAILYELLTGRPPFLAATPAETVEQVLADDPFPPTKLRPHLDRDLETICLKCLSKAPERRYATAAELADDLTRFLDHRPIIARRASWWERSGKWVRRHRATSAVVTVVLLAITSVLAAVANYNGKLRRAAEELRQKHELATKAQAETERLRQIAEERGERVQAELTFATATINDLLEALEFSSRDPHKTVDSSAIREKQLRVAVTHFERAAKLHPENALLKQELVKALYALAILTSQLNKSEHLELLVRCHEVSEHLRGTVSDHELDSQIARYRQVRAEHLRLLHRPADAEADCRLVVSLLQPLADSSDKHLSSLLNARLCLYVCLLEQGEERGEEAAQMFPTLRADARAALARYPELSGLGHLYVRIAMTPLRRAWRDHATVFELCHAVIDELEATVNATENADRKWEVSVGVADGYLRRGMAEKHLGDKESATKSLRKSIEISRELLRTPHPGIHDVTRNLSRAEKELRELAK